MSLRLGIGTARGNAEIAGPDELPARIAALARSASFEATPTEILQDGSWISTVRPNARVYIPHLPDARLSDTAEAAQRLRTHGLVPVPHIAARRLTSRSGLLELLARLRETDCKDLFLIGGSVAVPKGDFPSTMSLLRSGWLERYGIQRIGVAGYPEGSPQIDDGGLWRALEEKARFAEGAPFELYVVTQFCFQPMSISAWERRARELGNRLSVHVGVPGWTSLPKLLHFASMCGVRISADNVRQGWRAVASTLSGWSPMPTILSVAMEMLSNSDTLLKRMHFFPFGGLTSTIAWLDELGEGRLALR